MCSKKNAYESKNFLRVHKLLIYKGECVAKTSILLTFSPIQNIHLHREIIFGDFVETSEPYYRTYMKAILAFNFFHFTLCLG